MMKAITGKYEKDQNFITVYCDNTMYTIARNAGNWGSVRVGQMTFQGKELTQETYNKQESACENVGTFHLAY
jgi:hypothetical protein